MAQAERIEHLLQRMSDELKELNYIDGNFTVKENIAFDETVVFPMAGEIIAGYLTLPYEEKIKLLALGKGLPTKMAQDMRDGLKLKELVKKLDNA